MPLTLKESEPVKIWFDGSVKNDTAKWVAAYAVVGETGKGHRIIEIAREVKDASLRRSSTYVEYLGLLRAVQSAKKHALRNVSLITDYNTILLQLQGKSSVRTERRGDIARTFDKARSLMSKMKSQGVRLDVGLCGEFDNPAHYLAYAATDKLARRDRLDLPDNPAARKFRQMMILMEKKLLRR